jgi:hypothetical protein
MPLNINCTKMNTEWDACSDEEQEFLCGHPFGGNLGFYAMLGGMPCIPNGNGTGAHYGFTAKKFYERAIVIADISGTKLPDFFTLTWVNAMVGWTANVSYHSDHQFNEWVSENAQENAVNKWKKYQDELLEAHFAGGEEE